MCLKYLSESIELCYIGYSREEHQLVTARILIASNEVSHALRACQKTHCNSLREKTCESVVISQIAVACFHYAVITECEVPLCPELWLARATCVTPCGK